MTLLPNKLSLDPLNFELGYKKPTLNKAQKPHLLQEALCTPCSAMPLSRLL